jgi:hypothetical protein
MTTASKFGAQDLNGNPFNYQQIVAPASSSNIVVNTNFANRNGADAKVRLAATSVPLVSQTVNSTQGLYPYAATTSAASTTIPTIQTLTVSNTTAGTNLITIQVVPVTGTAISTNLITCTSTASFVVNEPMVFSGNLGNLVAGTVYYILTINSNTTFTVSTTLGGIPYNLVTAYGTINVQETTSNLQLNEPVVFTGVSFGGINTGLTYYVATIPSITTFTVSTFPSGPISQLFTATGVLTVGFSTTPAPINLSSTTTGTSVSTLQTLTISNTTTSTNVFTSASVAVTATTVSTNLITTTSTATLSIGQPVVFSGSLGNLISGTVYYVQSIPSTTTFTVASTWGGAQFALATASGSINFQQATSNLTANQPIIFQGTAIGGVIAQTTYYILTIPSNTTFTVSTTPGGNVVALYTASGTMILGSSPYPSTVNVSSTAATAITGAIVVTNTTTSTNLITCASTTTLAVNQPVVFSSNLGNLISGVTYYVLSIPGTTTFTVSATQAGVVYPLLTATGNITVLPQQLFTIASSSTSTSPYNYLSTASVLVTNTTVTTNLITCASTATLYAGLPIIFTGSTFGNIVNGPTYYVLTVNSSTTFTISTGLNGPVFVLTTASGTMYVSSSTANLAANQPVVFSSGAPTQIMNISNTTVTTNVLTTASIAVTATTVTTNVITAADTSSLVIGQPVVFSSALGNLAANTVYYVLTIPSSTQFTVSSSLNNTAFVLATASGSINVQAATANLIVNEPIVFTGTTFGNIVANTTYYIQSIVSNTTFTVSSTINGFAVALTTATGAAMTSTFAIPTFPLNIGSTTVTSNLITTATVSVTNTTVTTNVITCTSTVSLNVGQAIVFAGTTFGNIVAGTVYYVQSIPSTTTFTISLILNGSQFVLTTATGTCTFQHSTTGLVLNQGIIFNGTTFGNLTSNSPTGLYYILTINSTTTFTVSTVPGGTVFVQSTATGTLISNPTLLGGVIPGIPYYIQSVGNSYSFQISTTPGGSPLTLALFPQTGNANSYGFMRAVVSPNTSTNTNIMTTSSVAVTATTTGTNVITCSSSSKFAIGQPVVFSGALGGLVANTVYYVLTVPTSTTFTVSVALGGVTVALTSATGSITVQQSTAGLSINQPMSFSNASTPLTIASTTVSTNILTASAIAVTATTVTTNVITCSSTTTLVAGMPVVFDGNLGNLISGTVYYIAAVVSANTFTVSSTYNGTVFVLATASGTINVYSATTNLAVNQPIVFSGTTFGNIVAGTTYYVASIPSSTTFTVSASINGATFVLSTAAGTMTASLSTFGGIVAGTTYYIQSIPSLTQFTVSATFGGIPFILTNFNGSMNGNIMPSIQSVAISNTTVTTNVLTTASVAVTNTTSATNVITCTSTATLTIGQPVVFSGALSGLAANTTYYVLTIPSTTTFTVSTVIYGTALVLSTATGSINFQQSTAGFTINQPIVFTGSTFGNIAVNTAYYILAVVSPTTFTVTSSFNSAFQFVLSTSSGAMYANTVPTQILTVGNTNTSNQITTMNIAGTQTSAGTNVITVTSTFFFTVGMPVVFDTAVGNITVGTIYYVQSIPSAQQFTVSLWPNGPQVLLSTTTGGSFGVRQAVTNLVINQPVVFSGTTFGNIVAGTTYYVQSIASSSVFCVSATPGGSQFGLSSTSGTMFYTPLSTNITAVDAIVSTPIAVTATTAATGLITCATTSKFAIGQAIVFSGALGGLLASTVYYVLTIPSATTFSVSTTPISGTLALSGSTTVNINQVALVDATGSINVQHSSANLSIGQPIILTSPYAPLTLSNTTVTTNVITTATIAITATTATTNYITATSTSTLTINQPVVFSGALGNLVSSTVYYVASIPSSTQFSVSSTINGTLVTLTTASGSINVQQATTGLIVNQPIVFSGTAFGNIVSGTTYYIQSIASNTTFTISASYNGAVFALTTASGSLTGTFTGFGNLAVNTIYYIQSLPSLTSFILSNILGSATTTTLNATSLILTAGAGALVATVITPVPTLTISNTTVTTNVFTTATVVVSATTTGTNIITCNSTSSLVYGQPVVFSATLGGLSISTVYYVLNILNTTQFTISTSYGGTQVALTTAAGSVNVQASTTNLVIGQPIVFFGAVFGGPTQLTTYYVNSIISTTTFTVSSLQYYGYSGTAITLSTTSGTMTAVYGPIQMPLIANTAVNYMSTQPITVSQTSVAGTNLITCTNTYMLGIGQPVVFSASLGGLTANVIYYVTSIPSAFTFSVSIYPNGPTYSLTYATSSISVYQAVTNLWLGQPIVFGSDIAGKTVFGNILTSTVYYVSSLQANNAFTVSTTPNGSVYVLTSAASTSYAAPMTYIAATLPIAVSNVYVGQAMPISTTSASGNAITTGNLLSPSTRLPISITGITSTTNVLTCTDTTPLSIGLPIVFSSSISGLVGNTTYYVLNILSSTQFTVANTWGGQQVILTATGVTPNIVSLTITGSNQTYTNSLNVTSGQNTYNLYPGMPIVFTGTTFVGQIVIGTTYYVSQVTNSTNFSISTTPGGSVLSLSGATGTMGMLSAQQVTSLGVTVQPSTANLSIGQPLYTTGSTFGNVQAGLTYYVNTVLSPTQFTITATQYSGTQFTLTSNTGFMYFTMSTGNNAIGSTSTSTLVSAAPIMLSGATINVTNTYGTLLTTTGNTGCLTVNQPVLFTGYTIGGIQANTYYYVQSIPTYNTFTLSATVNGPAISWGTTSNLMTAQLVNSVGTSLLPYKAYYVQGVQSPFTFSITSLLGGNATSLTTSAGTIFVQSNICTLAAGGSTAFLAPNQLLTFTGTSFGNLQTLPTTTLPFIVTNTTVTSNYITVSNTATLIVNQPVVFMGTTWGGIVANTTYYILTINSSTQFTISSTIGGTAIVLSSVAAATATPAFYMVPAYYVKAIISSTQFVLSASPNGAIQPLITAYATGGNVLLANGQPVNTDFIEFDSLIAGFGVLERTGIIIPPNTYLYASSNVSQVTALAIGIQEAV